MNRRLGFSPGKTQLFVTRDGGATATPVGRLPFFDWTLTFVDARHGVATGVAPKLSRTADGGRHWMRPRLPGGQPAHVQFWGVASFGRRLVVPADDLAAPHRVSHVAVYASPDAGATWTMRSTPRWWHPVIGSNDPASFSAASPTAWFYAAFRQLVVTTDAGQTWRRVRPIGLPPHWTIATIDFTSPRVGWAIFFGPRAFQHLLVRTTDGGVHWSPAGPLVPRHRKR